MLWKELFAERPVFTLGVIGLIAQWLLFLGVLVPALFIFIKRLTSGSGGFVDELQIYVMLVGTTVACVGLLTVAVRAASSVTAERERQTWDVLMSTPIEPWEVVRGKIAGSLSAMRGVVLLLVILWTLGVFGGAVWPFVVPVVAGELALFGGFAAVVGLLFSLKMRTSLRAMAATVGTTVFVGGAYLFCCLPVLWSGPGDSEFVLAGCVPFLLGAPIALNPNESPPWGNWEASITATFIVGMGLYVMATFLLFAVARSNFDDLTGRICRYPLGLERHSRRLVPDASNEPGVNPTVDRALGGRAPSSSPPEPGSSSDV
jgi:ABC-type transport system involved in multi-copper enzyme maturation permease subunit